MGYGVDDDVSAKNIIVMTMTMTMTMTMIANYKTKNQPRAFYRLRPSPGHGVCRRWGGSAVAHGVHGVRYGEVRGVFVQTTTANGGRGGGGGGFLLET